MHSVIFALDSVITEVGVGGILALLVIREVFGFLRSRNGSNSNGHGASKTPTIGQMPPEYWQLQMRSIFETTIAATVTPLFNRLCEALDRQTDAMIRGNEPKHSSHNSH